MLALYCLFALVLQLTGNAYAYEDYFMRVEAQIIRLENPQGLTASGRPCGGQFASRQCNTVVQAQIDTDVSNAVRGAQQYGGKSGSDYNYKVLSTSSDDNDPHIGEVVSGDICGQAIEKAVVRVRITDQGSSGEHRINDFICESSLRSHYVLSVWSPVQLCQPEFQTTKMRLYFRYRVTRLERNQCRNNVPFNKEYGY
ncbi:hypothetical protein BV898_04771 [Hypsibius exemplaris]|uniref:Uncharacterized protein n=1 Tax=Hypsibius exemplaris TaxID=2072580 RepID=A0A1W0X1F0_HYPEX|nr:hypothetical protein BV898_04771 [Hypsibius exemplaris]